MDKITPEQIENDERYGDILDTGHGVPSSSSELGSIAIAGLLNWWARCPGVPPHELFGDVDDLIQVLCQFKDAVRQDPSLVTFPDGAEALTVELNDGTPHTVRPETHLVWREVDKVEEEDAPRLLVSHANPNVYETPLDGMFHTEQQAYEYLQPFGAEAGQELVLCRMSVVPVRVVKYTENAETGKWTVEAKGTGEALATGDY